MVYRKDDNNVTDVSLSYLPHRKTVRRQADSPPWCPWSSLCRSRCHKFSCTLRAAWARADPESEVKRDKPSINRRWSWLDDVHSGTLSLTVCFRWVELSVILVFNVRLLVQMSLIQKRTKLSRKKWMHFTCSLWVLWGLGLLNYGQNIITIFLTSYWNHDYLNR